jgi:hypothetical protein
MELFKIEWTTPCSLDDADKYVPSDPSGVYAVCITDGKTPKQFQYIGQTGDVSQRTRQHTQEWAQGLTSTELKRRVVSFGTIEPLEVDSTKPFEEFRRDVEKILLYTYKPQGNNLWFSRNYTREPILLINCGKFTLIDKVISSNHRVTKLLSGKHQSSKPLVQERKSKPKNSGGLFGGITVS